MPIWKRAVGNPFLNPYSAEKRRTHRVIDDKYSERTALNLLEKFVFELAQLAYFELKTGRRRSDKGFIQKMFKRLRKRVSRMGFKSRFGRLRMGKRNYPAGPYLENYEKRYDVGGFSIPDFQNFLWKLWNFENADDFDDTAGKNDKRSSKTENNDGFKPDNVMDMVTNFKPEKTLKTSNQTPKKVSKRGESDIIPRFASLGDRIKMISSLHRNKGFKMDERSSSKNDTLENSLAKIIRSYLLNLADLF